MKLKSAQIRNVTFHVSERPELFREGLVSVVNWRNRIRLTVVAIFMIANAFMHGQSTLATLRRSVRDASATPDFAIQRRTDVEFTVKAEEVNAEEVVHLNLYPATIESSVEVHAEGHGIDLESAALTRVVDPRAMRELPLNGPGLDSACAVGARRLGHSHSECTERKQLQSRNPPVWFSRDNWRSRPGQNSYLLSQNDMRAYPT